MLIVVRVTWRRRKPASCNRAAAAWVTWPSEKTHVQCAQGAAGPSSNSDVPPTERGDAWAKIRSGKLPCDLLRFPDAFERRRPSLFRACGMPVSLRAVSERQNSYPNERGPWEKVVTTASSHLAVTCRY